MSEIPNTVSAPLPDVMAANSRYLVTLVTDASTMRESLWLFPINSILVHASDGTIQVLTTTGSPPGLPMSSMSSPVKTTIDAITSVSSGDPVAYFTGLASQSWVTSQIAVLTAGSPDALNTFLETYNRFLADESAASAINSALSSEATTRGAADSTLTASIGTKQTAANLNTATLDFGFSSGQEGDVATATITAAWVTANSWISCLPSPAGSSDHSSDETLVEGIRFSAVNIVPGVSFDVESYAPSGTWGRHNCSVISF